MERDGVKSYGSGEVGGKSFLFPNDTHSIPGERGLCYTALFLSDSFQKMV